MSLTNPKRSIKGRVALLKGATTTHIDYDNDLIEIKVDRIGENGKFFGYGIAQKATIKIRDKDREYDIDNTCSLTIYFSDTTKEELILYSPVFYVEEVKRDENNNNLTITAYDGIYKLNNLKVNELGINGDYYIDTLIEAIKQKTKASVTNISTLSSKYPELANLNGNEKVRDVLDDIAEVSASIYYMDEKNRLYFRKPKANDDTFIENGLPTYICYIDAYIGKDSYFTLQTKENYTLYAITHITELGDNLTSSKEDIDGVTQYIKENCFLNNNPDAATRLNEILEEVAGETLTEFNCSWRGNYTVPLTSSILLENKNNEMVKSILVNDSYTYNGGFKQNSNWSYEVKNEATAATPTTIGEAINETLAKVDKVNKQITLLASEQEAQSKSLAELVINTGNITSTVSTLEENIKEGIDSVNNDISELNSKITQTAENLNIEFTNKIGDIDSITTSTGFTFNKDGLTVSKSGSEMTTQITEDGMKVYRNDEEMLTANNQGVNAVNLHATTYLIIGNNSRFEDMGSSRTGCFWIGG